MSTPCAWARSSPPTSASSALVWESRTTITTSTKGSRSTIPRYPTWGRWPSDHRTAVARLMVSTEYWIPVAIAPVVPGITDHELEALVEAAAEAGAGAVFYLPVRLPWEVAPLFRAWLDEHFPDRAAKVMAIIRDMRGGKDNDPNWFTRMQGFGAWADLLRTRFERAKRTHGFGSDRQRLRTDLFEPPQGPQLRLL